MDYNQNSGQQQEDSEDNVDNTRAQVPTIDFEVFIDMDDLDQAAEGIHRLIMECLDLSERGMMRTEAMAKKWLIVIATFIAGAIIVLMGIFTLMLHNLGDRLFNHISEHLDNL